MQEQLEALIKAIQENPELEKDPQIIEALAIIRKSMSNTKNQQQ